MALQKNIETPEGVVAPSAYIVIESLVYNKKDTENNTAGIAKAYVDLAARDAGKEALMKFPVLCNVDVEGVDNFVVQAYNAFKATDEMAGAIDV